MDVTPLRLCRMFLMLARPLFASGVLSVPCGISGTSDFRPQFPLAYTSCIEVRGVDASRHCFGDDFVAESTREFFSTTTAVTLPPVLSPSTRKLHADRPLG